MKTMEESLRGLGFNQYESRVYLSLLQHGPLTASEVSSKAKIPRPRVYDVLESLADRGIVLVSPGRPNRFKAVDANTLVEILKKEERERLEKKFQKYERIKQEISGVAPKDKAGGENVWLLKGEKAVHTKIREIIDNSKEEIIIAGNKNSIARKLSLHGDALENARKRGVKIRIVSTEHHKGIPEETIKLPAPRMVIGDDHAVLFLHEKEYNNVLLLKSKHLANGLKSMIKKR